MRFLLFGPGGQVGMEICRLAGADAIPVSRSACDLTMAGAARRAIEGANCEAAINAAGYTGVDKAETDEATAQAVNATAPGEMAAACAARGVPFVHLSTDYVFDGAASRPYVEADETGPLSVYGATKLAGERLVAEAGGAHAIIRLSWVFSAHGSNFVKTMLRLGRERASLRVVADQFGKPTPASAAGHAALAAARALKGDSLKSGLYHYAGDEATTWADFASAIFDCAGMTPSIERIATAEYPTPARRPLYSVLDTRKFEGAFGLAPAPWRAALDDVCAELARA